MNWRSEDSQRLWWRRPAPSNRGGLRNYRHRYECFVPLGEDRRRLTWPQAYRMMLRYRWVAARLTPIGRDCRHYLARAVLPDGGPKIFSWTFIHM